MKHINKKTKNGKIDANQIVAAFVQPHCKEDITNSVYK